MCCVNKGTIFRYCPQFRYTLEDNGTEFRYLIIQGEYDREQRNSGMVFPYFENRHGIRVNSILQFRYLLNSLSPKHL
jgi:hypothetical protein